MAKNIQDCPDLNDIFALARRRLPGPIFDFLMSGSEQEITLRRNSADFDSFTFRPRIGIDVSQVDTSTTIFGRKVSMPLIAAPAGGMGMFHPDGEAPLARAFSQEGLMYGLSMFTTRSIEDVAAAGDGPRLFQLYFLKDDHIVDEMVDAAKIAHYDAVCVTLDVPAQARRPKVDRWQAMRPRPPAKTIWEFMQHPRYAFAQRKAGKRPLADVTRRITEAGRSLHPDFYTDGIRGDINWADIERVRKRWGGPFAVKGIMCAEDARRAIDIGATALIVCNHGGIGLDGAPSTISVIPEIVDEAGPDIEVIQSGGLRRGSDIVKALALGAKAAMTARPFIAGLTIDGEAGVRHVLQMLRADFVTTMKLTGCTSVSAIDRRVLTASAERKAA